MKVSLTLGSIKVSKNRLILLAGIEVSIEAFFNTLILGWYQYDTFLYFDTGVVSSQYFFDTSILLSRIEVCIKVSE